MDLKGGRHAPVFPSSFTDVMGEARLGDVWPEYDRRDPRKTKG
jgi:hypothetical protein